MLQRTALFTAINMPGFREEGLVTAEEPARRITQKHPAVIELYNSVTTHTEVPHSLD
ncbi:MAG: hypothetical protein ACE5LL_09450 [Alphaproteobacteria bacterium]